MRAVLIALTGCALALLLSLGVAFIVTRSGRPKPAPTASAGLQVQQGAGDSRTPATKSLRCFVGGQFVGMATVAECAAKNGVAAQALDTGLDPATGAAPNGSLAPPPPPAPEPAQTEAAVEGEPGPAAATGECLRYAADGWKPAASGVSVTQCARALFEGRCVRAGDAAYGRWAGDTLRLVQGRVEMSTDNRVFHPLVSQNPDCSLPPG